VLDGRLNDPIWDGLPVLDAFRQVEPVEGAPATVRTEVRIARDDQALYFGIRCFDPNPEGIVALRMTRDAFLLRDDSVSIILSPFDDHRSGYLFQLNPNGARRDGLVEDQAFSVEWDGIWNAKARIDEQGWTLEIAIPFDTLSFDPANDVWGFNIARTVRQRNELLRWAAVDRDLSFRNLATAGELTGMAGAEHGLGLDLVLSSTTRWVEDPQGSDGQGRSYSNWDPSLDVFYRPSPRATAVLTINTDFGETEVDAQRVNLTRFPLFFREKRDFFLQDTGIFNFGGLGGAANGRPFFSRRIGRDSQGAPIDLRAGLKVTGRVGPVSFGLLDVQTAGHTDANLVETGPGGVILDNGFVGARNLAVLRTTVDVLEQSRVGFIGTYGDQTGREKTGLFGFDGVYRTSRLAGNRQLLARGWFQRSETSGVAKGQQAWGGVLAYPNDALNAHFSFAEIGRNFDPALGRVSRPAIRDYGGSLRLRRRTEGAIRFVQGKVDARLITDLSNRVETGSLRIELPGVETRAGDFASLTVRLRHEALPDDFEIVDGVVLPPADYSFAQGTFFASTSSARRLSGSVAIGGGQFFSGHRVDLTPSLGWRPSAPWLFTVFYRETRAWLPEGDFEVRVARLRAQWQPTPDFVWSTLLQWDDQTNLLGLQSRIRWIVEPGREIFLVWTQNVVEVDQDIARGQTILTGKIGWTIRF
jgi:hypothetical protein